MLRQRTADRTLADRTDVSRICVSYEAMNRDWRGEMGRIYHFLGLDLPAALLGRMDHWLKGEHSHLDHRYSLEQFGLGRDEVPTRPAFSAAPAVL